jgi:hypothetical protein
MKRSHEDWVHNIKLDHGRRATLAWILLVFSVDQLLYSHSHLRVALGTVCNASPDQSDS